MTSTIVADTTNLNYITISPNKVTLPTVVDRTVNPWPNQAVEIICTWTTPSGVVWGAPLCYYTIDAGDVAFEIMTPEYNDLSAGTEYTLTITTRSNDNNVEEGMTWPALAEIMGVTFHNNN